MDPNHSYQSIERPSSHCIVDVESPENTGLSSGDLNSKRVARDLQQGQYNRPPINTGGLLASSLVAGGVMGAGGFVLSRYVGDWTPLIYNGINGAVCGCYAGAQLAEYVTGEESKVALGAGSGLMAGAKLGIVINLIPIAVNSGSTTIAIVSGLSGAINGAFTGAAAYCHRQISRYSGSRSSSDALEQP
ncbi:hypothetical protein MUA02_01070 [Enterobacteriaceae bacterium H20N1]|uniref:Uncharacterized protein n=1 Tax=Dryocola boscaweniae TaxID=2925397 RepID=A0A9X2W5Q9_9ENTR|nr:hypothetical protein [Dryocola boscaweniae]MCT4700498.1 hypothetical protein [Dryocola boscaweniae]MCT4717654.1 hypothetical protein [Dryocola boscaweniae]